MAGPPMMSKYSIRTEPACERDLELFASPSIQEQMPITLASGNTWTGYEGNCQQCERPIDQTLLRGNVRCLLPTIAEIEAVGYCNECQLVTRFFHRLHNDMRITGPTLKGWAECRPQQSFLLKLMTWLKNQIRSASDR